MSAGILASAGRFQASRGKTLLRPIGFPALSQRRKFLWPGSAAGGAENGDVRQFLAAGHAAQQEAAATHVSAPHKVSGKTQPLAEVGEEAFDIFTRGDAPQEDDLVDIESRERRCRCRERFDVTRIGDIHLDGGKFPETGGVHGRIPRQQSARWSNHLRAGDGAGRPRKAARIGELSAEVQAAAKGEYFSQGRVADLDAASEFEGRLRPEQHPCSEASGVGGREKEDPRHSSMDGPAPAMGYAKLRRFIT